MLIFYLPPFVVHVIIVLIDQFRNRHKGIPFIFQCGNEGIKRLGGKFCPIMAKDNAAISKMFVLCLSYFVVVSLLKLNYNHIRKLRFLRNGEQNRNLQRGLKNGVRNRIGDG